MDKNFGKGFGNGLGNFGYQTEEYKQIREKIKRILKVKSNYQFRQYVLGKMVMDVNEARQVEELFKSYGIEHPWNQI
ncbi:hypothetical protein IJ707_03910 [bacterium]|nr:hypothetical protein [bacterium]